MKNYVIFSALLAVHVSAAFAQEMDQGDCDPEYQDCSQLGSIKEPNKTIYPYKPFETTDFMQRLKSLHEGDNFILNVFELEKKNLNRADTKIQRSAGREKNTSNCGHWQQGLGLFEPCGRTCVGPCHSVG